MARSVNEDQYRTNLTGLNYFGHVKFAILPLEFFNLLDECEYNFTASLAFFIFIAVHVYLLIL